ncbi:hypothetical protein M5689_000160 [Euphorbia peplus]|nr:hypothetical protein M5689_000160 [Euphorbia peplus]
MGDDLEPRVFDEEDVFYHELRKQILYLTEVDDNDDFIRAKRSSKRSMAKPIVQAGNCFNRWEIRDGNLDPTPTWLVNLWKNGNGGIGTGVFIPQVHLSSRKLLSGNKKNNGRRRIYKQVGNI